MVTLGELVKLLTRRAVRPCCPVCGNETFDELGNTRDTSLALLHEDNNARWFGPPLYVRVNSAACARCGYVLLFDSRKLEAWKGQ
jgi:hypothetical protein